MAEDMEFFEGFVGVMIAEESTEVITAVVVVADLFSIWTGN